MPIFSPTRYMTPSENWLFCYVDRMWGWIQKSCVSIARFWGSIPFKPAIGICITLLGYVVFPEQRKSFLENVRTVIGMLADGPDNAIVKWLLIMFVFSLIAILIYRSTHNPKLNSQEELEEIKRLLQRPNRLIEICVRQNKLRTAKRDLEHSSSAISRYCFELKQFRDGGPVCGLEFNKQLEHCRARAADTVDLAMSLTSPLWGNLDMRSPSFKLTEVGKWYPDFVPDQNSGFFLEHEHNIKILTKAADALISWIETEEKNSQSEIDALMEDK